LAELADAPGAGSLRQIASIGEKSAAAAHSIGRRQRFDRQGVNLACQHVGERRVDQAVARHGGNAAKRFGHDAYAKVTRSPGRSGMAGVPVTFVLDCELQGRKTGYELPAQALFARDGSHGGAAPDSAALTLLFSHSTWGIMNSSMAALMPNTLKFTHALSAKLRAT